MSRQLNTIDVVILCGGKGERLKQVVGDRPKPMALIGKTPFLRVLIDHIATFGFKRFILCVGYGQESIRSYIEACRLPLEIILSREQSPLGTGGAVKHACNHVSSSPFLVLNGDSLFRIDYAEFVRSHEQKQGDCSIALFKSSESCADYGKVLVSEKNRIVAFKEKESTNAGQAFCNGGIYLFEKKLLNTFPSDEAFSLEYDYFPRMTGNNVFGYISDGEFIDIGTPARYQQAQKILGRE